MSPPRNAVGLTWMQSSILIKSTYSIWCSTIHSFKTISRTSCRAPCRAVFHCGSKEIYPYRGVHKKIKGLGAAWVLADFTSFIYIFTALRAHSPHHPHHYSLFIFVNANGFRGFSIKLASNVIHIYPFLFYVSFKGAHNWMPRHLIHTKEGKAPRQTQKTVAEVRERIVTAQGIQMNHALDSDFLLLLYFFPL